MKWKKPEAHVQNFVADEYVASCGLFTDTDILIKGVPTDGKLTEPGRVRSWNKQGFNDDGFDFLAGEDDTCPMDGGSQIKGWYGNRNSLGVIVSGKPVSYSGRYGNHTAAQRYSGTMANPVYYFGNNFVEITKKNHKQYGCGPNAS